MPSSAFGTFEYSIVDVDRLIESHTQLHDGSRGKKGLGHITRSGVVMLCAGWELYIENVLLEGGEYLVKEHTNAQDLPTEVQKQISLLAKNDKNDLSAIKITGEGWKNIYVESVRARTENLNTPKSKNLVPLLRQLLGIEDISGAWSLGIQPLDDFVTIRGEIAHTGRHADYILIGHLENYRSQIRTYAVETDNFVGEYLTNVTPRKRKPWNVTK